MRERRDAMTFHHADDSAEAGSYTEWRSAPADMTHTPKYAYGDKYQNVHETEGQEAKAIDAATFGGRHLMFPYMFEARPFWCIDVVIES